MRDNLDLPSLPGYVSIKDAAKLLGLADRTVYEYVEEGRLPGVRAADVIMISLEEVKKFKRGTAGRPRKRTPPWRISSGDNAQFSTFISVQIQTGQYQAFLQKLEMIRQDGQHVFPGTIARFIVVSDDLPEQVEIALIWRKVVIPDSEEREQALNDFRIALKDVVDWNTAQYRTGTVVMHT